MGEDLLPIKQARAFRKFSYLPTHTVHTSTRRFDAMGYWTLFYIEPLSKYCRYGNEKNSVTRSFANGVILYLVCNHRLGHCVAVGFRNAPCRENPSDNAAVA